MKEKERNGRLITLLERLMESRDIEMLQLIETMVNKDTQAMKKAFEIVTKNKLGWVSFFTNNDNPDNC